MRIAPSDYPALKSFWEWMLVHVVPVPEALEPEGHPLAIAAAFEARSMSIARQGLGLAIGDLIEQTDDLSLEQIRAIDVELAGVNLLTLSEVRGRFHRKVRAIMRRGAIRNEAEYHALRNVADALMDGDRARAWQMLGVYESSLAGEPI